MMADFAGKEGGAANLMVVPEVRREGLTGPTRSSALVLKPKLKSRRSLDPQQWLPVVTPSHSQVIAQYNPLFTYQGWSAQHLQGAGLQVR